MMRGIDQFAGLGGWTFGGRQAGIDMIWAANHWPEAVHWHSQNHPDAEHVCQNLHQCDWSQVPEHDLMLASPCCQGHSKARGKASGNPQHDASRSTAWAPVSCLEFHRPEFGVIENTPEFVQWELYPAWKMAVRALGYQISPHIVDCADLGVPQHRVRIFIVLSRSRAPLMLNLQQHQLVPASSFIDFSAGTWSEIERPGRAAATLERVRNGRRQFGKRFLMPYYGSGSGLTGRSLERPIGTITTRDRWALVDGDRMRMLTANECLAAMSFPKETLRPDNHRLTVHMAGNAVPPIAGQKIIEAIMTA